MTDLKKDIIISNSLAIADLTMEYLLEALLNNKDLDIAELLFKYKHNEYLSVEKIVNNLCEENSIDKSYNLSIIISKIIDSLKLYPYTEIAYEDEDNILIRYNHYLKQ